MTDLPFSIAFAGAGRVSELHERALRRIPGGRLHGLFDPDRALARRRADEWSCRAYGSAAEMLADPGIDGVFVLGPAETHERAAIAALEAGKHVLVEKPVACIDGLRRLLAVASATGRLCMPGHTYAYQPEFLQLRELVAESSFGRVRAAWIHYVIKHSEELAANYGGVLDELMVHHSYLTLALFGRPDWITASRTRTGWSEIRNDDQAWMTWEWDGGLSAHLFASFAIDDSTSDSWKFMVKVLGTKGGGTYRWADVAFDRALGTHGSAIPAYENAFVHQDRAFIHAARTGEADGVVSPLEHALCVAQLLATADVSDRSQRTLAP